MRTLHYFILVISLAASINPRTFAAAAAVQKCDVNSLPSTAEQLQDPGQEPTAFLFAKGVRVFNCSTGTPSITSGGLVNVTDGGLMGSAGAESNWTGSFFITLDYSTVQFVPAPDGKSLDWALWKNIFTVPRTLQEELGIGWGSRVDTIGGEEPNDCSNIFANNSVVVEYTAMYYFYPCPSITSSNDSSLDSTIVSPPPEQAVQEMSAASITLAAAPMLLSVVLSVAFVAADFKTRDLF
ncbi:hypothetical protein Ndes2526B_g07148 [Nannochloris sp. 'desiccata']